MERGWGGPSARIKRVYYIKVEFVRITDMFVKSVLGFA
jgi:hypothetical protein